MPDEYQYVDYAFMAARLSTLSVGQLGTLALLARAPFHDYLSHKKTAQQEILHDKSKDPRSSKKELSFNWISLTILRTHLSPEAKPWSFSLGHMILRAGLIDRVPSACLI